MTPFLKQIASHYHGLADIEKRCFVFPNRRAMAFFKKYLGECVRESGSSAFICPELYTIDDFVLKLSKFCHADRIQLLLELYKCYSQIKQNPEPVDEFIGWGETILSDFNDIDKYLVDPKNILINVSEFRQMQDPLDYMTEAQLDALRRFVSNFDELKGTKRAFLANWEILYPLYVCFNASLDKLGIAYDGKIYRSVAGRLDTESVADMLSSSFSRASRSYVFVGLNALNECEKKLISRMRSAGLAECCWDFSSDMIRNPDNRSSHFLSENIGRFGQAVNPDVGGLDLPEFNVVSVPSSVGQAKQLPEIFSRICPDGKVSMETAVVIPDESLLIPVINTIPESVSSINVTMGYPMSGSQIHALMRDIMSLQMSLRDRQGKLSFYHKPVWSILTNSIIRTVMTERCREIVAAIKAEHRYYIDLESFETDPLLNAIFKKCPQTPASCLDYLKDILCLVGSLLSGRDDMVLEMDFAMEYHKALTRLGNYVTDLRQQTLFRLIEQLAGRISVPFRGEPLNGLQIMGPLETRSLDFEKLVILNCNEGLFPRHSVASSFIPAELRKGFGLPTYEYQDAVWAYYFYRMIQRASKVWMLYDSCAETSRSGEESRYIKQIELHFGAKINRFVVKSPVHPGRELQSVKKTEEHIRVLRDKHLSATALQHYLECPAMFYYEKVLGLRERGEINESLDSGMLGTVFHNTMEQLYRKAGGTVSRKYLASVLDSSDRIRSMISSSILEQLGVSEVEGRNIIYEDMVLRYVCKAIERDIELMETHGTDHITIHGLECFVRTEIGGFNFIGYIDRLDSLDDYSLRVVDYKTGRVKDEDLMIDESNAASVVDAVFGPNSERRPKIALQIYLYDRFLKDDPVLRKLARGKKVINSIYQTQRLFVERVPEVELCSSFVQLMDERLDSLLAEIASPDIDFERRGTDKTCEYCNFKSICGK